MSRGPITVGLSTVVDRKRIQIHKMKHSGTQGVNMVKTRMAWGIILTNHRIDIGCDESQSIQAGKTKRNKVEDERMFIFFDVTSVNSKKFSSEIHKVQITRYYILPEMSPF